jgi:hypothetical protein
VLFSSPLVRNHLIEIPSQQEIYHNVDSKTNESIANHILVDDCCKISIELKGLCVKHCPEGKYKSSMWKDANGSIYGQGRVV